MSEQVRCDQCGAIAPRGDREGWFRLWRNRKQTREELLRGFASWECSSPSPDLCSWQCVSDYATVQLLDPKPEPLAPE